MFSGDFGFLYKGPHPDSPSFLNLFLSVSHWAPYVGQWALFNWVFPPASKFYLHYCPPGAAPAAFLHTDWNVWLKFEQIVLETVASAFADAWRFRALQSNSVETEFAENRSSFYASCTSAVFSRDSLYLKRKTLRKFEYLSQHASDHFTKWISLLLRRMSIDHFSKTDKIVCRPRSRWSKTLFATKFYCGQFLNLWMLFPCMS